jgi:hypothetical protein
VLRALLEAGAVPHDHLAVPQLELAGLRQLVLGPGQELIGRHLALGEVRHDDGIPYVCGAE